MLTDDERRYYARQTIVPGWGDDGQLKLKNSRVLVVGAGGLGAPVLLYLAGAGIGHIGIVDGDFVEISNLHRQIVHDLDSLDTPKTSSAAASLRKINPYINVEEHALSLTRASAHELIAPYDIVCDCTDNFATREIIAHTCQDLSVPLVTGAAQITDGMITTFKPYLGAGYPCFNCLYPVSLGPELTPSCSQIGVVGPVLSVVGGLQAMEVIKETIGFGERLSGRVLIYDGMNASINEVILEKRPQCRCSGSVERSQPFSGIDDRIPVTHR